MFLIGEMCAQEQSECSFTSYDYELTGNLAQCNENKQKKKLQQEVKCKPVLLRN